MPTSTRPIADIARELGLGAEEWLPYGRDKAKVLLPALAARRGQPDGKLVVVSSITPIKSKLETIATRVYGAERVDYPKRVERQIAQAESLGYGRLPVCVAKTQRSLSDNPTLLNRPRGFRVTVNDVRISAGAGFLVAQAGDIITMPGLPRKPNAEGVDVTPEGAITGLF
jgi:formate--tetrahydrofolate ligase